MTSEEIQGIFFEECEESLAAASAERSNGSDTAKVKLPAGYWTAANVKPGQLPGFAPAGIKMQGYTNYSAFDFRNRMIDESSRQNDSFRALNVKANINAVTFDQVLSAPVSVEWEATRSDGVPSKTTRPPSWPAPGPRPTPPSAPSPASKGWSRRSASATSNPSTACWCG